MTKEKIVRSGALIKFLKKVKLQEKRIKFKSLLDEVVDQVNK